MSKFGSVVELGLPLNISEGVGTGGSVLLPSGSSFNPLTQITWVAAVWASDPLWANPADGGKAASWRTVGTAAGGDIANGTGANQPTYNASATSFAGKPALTFGGPSISLSQASDWASPVTFPYSIIWIGRRIAAGGGANERLVNARSDEGSSILLNFPTSNDFGLYAGGAGIAGPAYDTNPHLITAYINSGSNGRIAVDGAAGTTGNSGSLQANRFSINLGGSSVDFANQQVVFAGVYNGDVQSDASWASFKTWARSFYGLTLS